MKPLILITGATRGLGKVLARDILAAGFEVIGTGRSPRSPHDWPSADGLHYEQLDLGALEDLHQWVIELEKRHGSLFALINNAAIGSDGLLATFHDSQIEQLIQVNLTSTILLTKYVVRGMLSRGSGRIVNISSIAAHSGFSGLSVYAATKGGVNSFTRALAREVGKAGVTVNALAPGYMPTDMSASLPDHRQQSLLRRSPLGAWTDPCAVSAAAIQLLQPSAATITGSIWTIDAGMTA